MPTLRLFASAREAAGTARTEIEAATVAELLDKARGQFGERFGRVLDTSRVWVNGQPAEMGTPIGGHDIVAVLPPVSGGSSPAEAPAPPPPPAPEPPAASLPEPAAAPASDPPAASADRPALRARRAAGAARPPTRAPRRLRLVPPPPPDDSTDSWQSDDWQAADWPAADWPAANWPAESWPAENRPPESERANPGARSGPPASIGGSVGRLALAPVPEPEPEPSPEPPTPTPPPTTAAVPVPAPVGWQAAATAPQPEAVPAPEAKPVAPLAVVHQSTRPHGRLGVAWAVVTGGMLVAGPGWLSAWMAVIAFVAASQTASVWRKRGERPLPAFAAATAAALPLTAATGLHHMNMVVAGAVVLTLIARMAAPTRAPSRDVALTLVIGFSIGMAAAAPVLLRSINIPAALYLLACAALYDVGAYLVGTGASSAWEGPAAGVVALLPLTMAAAVVLVPPFHGGSPLLLGALAAVLAPMGPLAGSALLGDRTAYAPALRRLDSLLIMGPIWAWCAAALLT